MQQKQEIKLVTQGRKFLLINSDLQKKALENLFCVSLSLCKPNLQPKCNSIQNEM